MRPLDGIGPPFYSMELTPPGGAPLELECLHYTDERGAHHLAFVRPIEVEVEGSYAFRILAETRCRGDMSVPLLISGEPWRKHLHKGYVLRGMTFDPFAQNP